MLQLKEITKDYYVGTQVVHALKGLSVNFRRNEFVAILGPSGCGKTTLLNIIGGLDKYTNGDLMVNGVSTKSYRDKDWDVYRNHRIGFIFQSYNLIPHQSVLSNVELALTIAGVSKEERIQRAKTALEKVGLGSEIHKRPNQLSGGQSQRVAIARALVNDPDILLADEPTGALDTETSRQIMDLVKEIAKERLVIMVTHNSDLADKYATRIVRLLDGKLVGDSNPMSLEEESQENKKYDAASEKSVKKEKAKMSFLTAFKLSLHNLFSKKRRTAMTSIAGSIGIIGISLVLSLSFGIQGYIDNMQNDMLSGNPVTISQSTYDLSVLMGSSMSTQVEIAKEAGWVNINSMIASLYKQSSIQIKNDINQDYIDFLSDMPAENNASMHFDYGLDVTNNIYTDFKVREGAPAGNISLSAIRNLYTWLLEQEDTYKEYSSFVTGLTNVFREAPVNETYLTSQYNILEGKVAKEKNEAMIVVNSRRELNDLLFAQLGYLTQDEFVSMARKAINEPTYDPEKEPIRPGFSFQELLGKEFVWYPNNTVFKRNNPFPTLPPITPFVYNPTSEGFGNPENSVSIKIVGILEPKENLSYGSLSSGLFYTQEFTKYIMEVSKNEVSQDTETQNIVNYFQIHRIPALASTTSEKLPISMPKYGFKFNGVIGDNGKMDLSTGDGYIFTSVIENIIPQGYEVGYSGRASSAMMALMSSMNGGSGGSEQTYVLYLQELSGGSLYGSDSHFETLPTNISVYSNSFEEKQLLLAYLDKWNSGGDITLSEKFGERLILASDRSEIKYTDTLSIVIEMINQLISAITIALIGFTSLALLVSCVMIGIITYVSVVERIKEIGVIRSLGGRKRDVSYLFNAETFIIGSASGLIGICFTWFVSFMVNLIVLPLINFSIAVFPLHYAAIMLLLSIGLTLVSGLFPSRSAAKKDPVVALRTE